jgi:hypothetical protein
MSSTIRRGRLGTTKAANSRERVDVGPRGELRVAVARLRRLALSPPQLLLKHAPLRLAHGDFLDQLRGFARFPANERCRHGGEDRRLATTRRQCDHGKQVDRLDPAGTRLSYDSARAGGREDAERQHGREVDWRLLGVALGDDYRVQPGWERFDRKGWELVFVEGHDPTPTVRRSMRSIRRIGSQQARHLTLVVEHGEDAGTFGKGRLYELIVDIPPGAELLGPVAVAPAGERGTKGLAGRSDHFLTHHTPRG